ncbi:hypothetical protein ABC382_22090 [Lysinibacillus sp. 1P01SD]|uniref:hypothetical protein n=1 Tax=Lysinibacillus TaxID=400634 RepID=UPI003883A893
MSLIDKSTFIGLRDVTAILTMYKTGIRINTLGQLRESYIDWGNYREGRKPTYTKAQLDHAMKLKEKLIRSSKWKKQQESV